MTEWTPDLAREEAEKVIAEHEPNSWMIWPCGELLQARNVVMMHARLREVEGERDDALDETFEAMRKRAEKAEAELAAAEEARDTYHLEAIEAYGERDRALADLATCRAPSAAAEGKP